MRQALLIELFNQATIAPVAIHLEIGLYLSILIVANLAEHTLGTVLDFHQIACSVGHNLDAVNASTEDVLGTHNLTQGVLVEARLSTRVSP